MATNIKFPDIEAPSWSLDRVREDIVLRAKMSNGIEATSLKFPKPRNGWKLTWESMTDADHDILENFFENTLKYGSLSFNWMHPLKKTTKEYRFSAPIEDSQKGIDKWQVKCTITEV